MIFLTKVGKIVNSLLPFAQGFGRYSRLAKSPLLSTSFEYAFLYHRSYNIQVARMIKLLPFRCICSGLKFKKSQKRRKPEVCEASIFPG